MNTDKPETAEEYMAMVKQFAWLVDVELKRLEETASKEDLGAVARRLPGLISAVNTVGYLRGQDGFFTDRPPGLAGENQKQLYAMEDEAEQRLYSLIGSVCKNPESRREYLLYLRTYYLQNRVPQEYRASPEPL